MKVYGYKYYGNFGYQIKRLIRLLKYWNVRNYRVYSSFDLENHIAGRTFYLCTSLEDYFFDAISGYYTKGYKYLALSELKDVFPVP